MHIHTHTYRYTHIHMDQYTYTPIQIIYNYLYIYIDVYIHKCHSQQQTAPMCCQDRSFTSLLGRRRASRTRSKLNLVWETCLHFIGSWRLAYTAPKFPILERWCGGPTWPYFFLVIFHGSTKWGTWAKRTIWVYKIEGHPTFVQLSHSGWDQLDSQGPGGPM